MSEIPATEIDERDDPVAGPSPTLTHDVASDHLAIDYHGDRPDEVAISTELFDQMVADRNALVDLVRRQQDVLAIVRLGRRPSLTDWASIGPIPLHRPLEDPPTSEFPAPRREA